MIELLRTVKRRLIGIPMKPIPVTARHLEYSAIMSADDDPAVPTPRLIDIALRAARTASELSMRAVVERMS